jgi:hypothetical protein
VHMRSGGPGYLLPGSARSSGTTGSETSIFKADRSLPVAAPSLRDPGNK